jgi:two-component system sensor kinase FixL
VHPDGRIALVNQQAERVFGYERQEMLDGMAIEQLLPARLRAKHVVHRQGYVAAPNVRPMGKRAMSLVGLRKNGEEFPADINIGPLNTEQGLLTVSVIRDLTEKRRMEAEAGRHREELARVQRVASLGELQAAVAHELNQPLTAVLSNAQAGVRFLDQEPPNISELKEIFSDIIANDRRAAEVIRRIRTLVKRTDVTRESVSVSEQIQRVLSLMQNDLRLKGVAVLFEFEDMPRIVADPVQIQQVVLNLLMNSVEAIAIAKQEAPTVTVSIRRDESTLRVAVEDNGCGIAEADVPRLFESFHTSKPDGLGMGLSICRSIVEAHGGRIWVAGTSRLGTTVSFSLPIDEGGAP